MLDRYGEKNKTYALVAGGADEISLAMCKHLALQGFNILMISKSETKMKAQIEQLQSAVPNQDLTFKYIVANLSKFKDIEEHRNFFEDKTKDLDVGVVIVNVG